MSARAFVLFMCLSAAPAAAQVVSYEGNVFPEEEPGWEHVEDNHPADRWIEDGVLVQYAEIVDPGPPELPERDTYYYPLEAFAGSPTFFVEWRSWSDGPQEGIPSVAPAAFVAFGTVGVNYHTTMSEDLIRIIRDVESPQVWVEIEPVVPHVYRIELYGDDAYYYYIDGELVDMDTPVGPYPTSDSQITFRGKAVFGPIHAWWDYARFGVIPETHGDFNSDSLVDSTDQYFFEECLSGLQGSWPGCAWADMNEDGSTDCLDWALFQTAWSGDEPVPLWSPCDCPADLSGDGVIGPFDLALVLGAWGTGQGGDSADLDGDGTVGPADLALVLGAWGPCQ